MFDSQSVEILKNRFAASLGNPDWEELATQLLCRFLMQNRAEIEKGKKKWLDQLLKGSFLFEKTIFDENYKNGSALVVGDEICALPSTPQILHAHYTEDSCKFFKKLRKETSSLWESMVIEKPCDQVFSLNMVSWLKSQGRVRELEGMMKKLCSALAKKGELLILDQQIYQDDFLIHLVSMDYEIVSIVKYGHSHSLIHAKP